jgi:hypothetical protein
MIYTFLITILLFCQTFIAQAEGLNTLPLDKGLPVIVQVGIFYQDITSMNENGNTFNGTVDLRLRWEDLRLRYPAENTPRGFQEFRGEVAETKIKEIWTPGLAFTNIIGTPSYQASSLRIYPNGQIEIMQRTTGQYSIRMNAGSFPFDRQILGVNVEILKESTDEASLIVLQEDLDFSHASNEIKLDGWDLGLVTVSSNQRPGWYGDFHSGITVGLQIKRQTKQVVAPIFIPLIASLLIPLVALWMNSIEGGKYRIEAFEVANVIVGGLFAVIALNFTVNSAYNIISSGDNTVSRLFALNYITLGLVLAIVILMYRFNVLKKFFSEHIEEEAYRFLFWALPVLTLCTATGLVVVAYVS